MMDFFDSPLFWIVVIWWLLSTFLGAKARKRRAMQKLTEQEAETPTATEPDEFQFGLESAEGEDATLPVGIEGEEEIPEPETQQVPQTRGYGDQAKTSPPRKAPLPKPPLEQLVRSLGIPKEFIPSGILREDEEPYPDVEATEPESLPGEEKTKTAPAVPVPEVSFRPEGTPATIEVAGGISHLHKTVLPSLTHLQQAIVLKEILDSPRALRRGIR